MQIRLKKLKLIGVVVFVLLFTSFGSVNISAQQPSEQSLTISPIVFELNSDPGDVITNQIKVYNATDFPQNVSMQIEDFSPIGDEGQIILEESGDNSTYSLASWAGISPTEFVLGSNQQQIVDFTITVPPNGEPGGHYGSILAQISGGKPEQSGTSVATKRGALILLRVSGNIKEDLIVDTFGTENFQEFGPVDFDVKFKNIGNIHVKPAGFVTITDMFGKQVAEIEIPQNNVIPEAVRQAGTTWEEEGLIGRYTATLVANYGSATKQSITAVTTFTVFPWKKGLLYGGIGLLIIFIILKSRKRISRATKVLLGG